MIKTNHHKCGKDVQKIENKTARQTSKALCPINNVWHAECFVCACVMAAGCWCCGCVSSFFCSQSEKMHFGWEMKSKVAWRGKNGLMQKGNWASHRITFRLYKCTMYVLSTGCMDQCVWKCFERLLTTPSKNTIKCYLLSQCSHCVHCMGVAVNHIILSLIAHTGTAKHNHIMGAGRGSPLRSSYFAHWIQRQYISLY